MSTFCSIRCLGDVSIELPAHLHQLVLHLRHRNIERRHDERVVDNLYHGAPLIPLLRPDLEEPVRPHSPEFFIPQREELGVPCHTRRLAPQRRVVRHGPNITAVMKGCCQGHLQRKLLVPPMHAQPTVTTPLRCPSFVVAMHRHVDQWIETPT